ncbi:hypothetical protein F1943_10545 [Akkermansia sp. BIOML-A21]|nr:hypothetical protein F1943_10545 [Akkermansia sp. BIOML-A21]
MKITCSVTHTAKESIMEFPPKAYLLLNVVDSTGKRLLPDNLMIVGKNFLQVDEEDCPDNQFHVILFFKELPAKTAKWIHIRGNVPLRCCSLSSSIPRELFWRDGMEEEFSAIDSEMVPEGPVADLAICKSETVTLGAELLQTYRNNSQLWKIHLSAIATFRFYGLELLDEQGLHVLFSLRPRSAFAGGGGAGYSMECVFPRAYSRLQARILYIDPDKFKNKSLPFNLTVGLAGTLSKRQAPSAR